MIAKTVTVNLQTRNKTTTTPKGRTRRTTPMTPTLYEALKRMSVIREGLVVRNLDGSAKTDDQADKAMARICRRAGLPVRLFHTLRHNTEPSIIRRVAKAPVPAPSTTRTAISCELGIIKGPSGTLRAGRRDGSGSTASPAAWCGQELSP